MSVFLTVTGAIKSARENCINELWKVCHNTINYLKQGRQCLRPAFNSESDEDRNRMRLSCCAILLGSAIFAAQELCNGQDWESVKNWPESPDHYYWAMLSFAERLDSARLFEDLSCSSKKQKTGCELIWEHHRTCELSTSTTLSIRISYMHSTVGLRLSDVGNHAYRVENVDLPVDFQNMW